MLAYCSMAAGINFDYNSGTLINLQCVLSLEKDYKVSMCRWPLLSSSYSITFNNLQQSLSSVLVKFIPPTANQVGLSRHVSLSQRAASMNCQTCITQKIPDYPNKVFF